MPSSRDETTLYVVCYDISIDKRRTKVHNTLSGYGAWTQYSLFECWLTRKELLELRAKLAKHLDARADSIRFYPLCEGCKKKVITVGSAEPEEQTVMII